MAVDPQVRRVVLGYRSQVDQLRARTTRFVTAAWGSLDDYRDAEIDRFAQLVAPVVEGAQVRVAALTDAYLAAYETAVYGGRVAPLGVPRDAAVALRGVDTVEVYRRPGVTVWTALSDGESFAGAVRKGLLRAEGLASTDVQLAKTHTSRRVLGSKGNVVGYRRVLEGGHSCGLCIVASTQRYRSEDLMPIHGGCSCSVQPIYGDRDPGQVIDPERLAGVHDAIAERFGAFDEGARDINDITSYRDVLVTHDHGELGPILGVRGQDFTGPTDV